MSLTVTRYNSGDAGIPNLTGQAGSLLAILDATLLPLGWTKPFSSGNVAVYRNSVSDGGTGVFVRVDDSDPQNATVNTLSEMTDIDTGGNGNDLQTVPGIWKSSTSNATARAFFVIADGLTAWIYIPNNGHSSGVTTPGSQLLGFGDCKPGQGANGFNWFAAGSIRGLIFSNSIGWVSRNGLNTDERRAICGPMDGLGASRPMRLRWMYWPTGNAFGWRASTPSSARTAFYQPDITSDGQAFYFGPPRGLWVPATNIASNLASPGQNFPGTDLTAVPVMVSGPGNSPSNTGITDLFIDSAGPW